MFKGLRTAINRHPYLAGMILSLAWILFWFLVFADGHGIFAFVFSGIPLGFIIGANRIQSWRDIFKKFPLAFAGFAVNAYVFTSISFYLQEAKGDAEAVGMVLYGMTMATIIYSPILLAGEFLGWKASRLTKI